RLSQIWLMPEFVLYFFFAGDLYRAIAFTRLLLEGTQFLRQIRSHPADHALADAAGQRHVTLSLQIRVQNIVGLRLRGYVDALDAVTAITQHARPLRPEADHVAIDQPNMLPIGLQKLNRGLK